MNGNIDIAVISNLREEIGYEALVRLIGVFIDESKRNTSEIADFLSAENLAGAEIVAHRFKSSARQFGANGLADLSQDIEKACATGDGDAAGQLAGKLPGLIRDVRAALLACLPPEDSD